MNFEIREATLNDVKDILALSRFLKPNTTTIEEARQVFKKFQKTGTFTQFVAGVDEKVVGIISIIMLPTFSAGTKMIGYLQRLVVHPDYRKQGIGRALVDKCIEIAKNNCYKLILHSKNPEAMKIYEKAGFKKHSTLLQMDFRKN